MLYQEYRDPLVIRIVERCPVMLPSSASALEVRRDVEVGIHPTIGMQHGLIYASSGLKDTIVFTLREKDI
jgi:hypothetical protein